MIGLLTIKLGLLEDLDLSYMNVMEWVDALACLLNVTTDAVWDPVVERKQYVIISLQFDNQGGKNGEMGNLLPGKSCNLEGKFVQF